MIFRNVVAGDLESLIQLEHEGFTKEEAATTQALKQRIEIVYCCRRKQSNRWLY